MVALKTVLTFMIIASATAGATLNQNFQWSWKHKIMYDVYATIIATLSIAFIMLGI